MSIEAIDPPDLTDEEKKRLYIEALISDRKDLQKKLGVLSANLCNITKSYNQCISDILLANTRLVECGIDTQALARELQADVIHPASL